MGKLFVCPTPIGNLGDITLRALETLRAADIIAAEDTRRTLQLLNHFDIKPKKLVSYYEHNKRGKGAELADMMEAGAVVALVSDAGTPGISDPGEDLISLCLNRGIPVESLPGACAAITALVSSGFPSGRFAFEGFLSTAKRSRAKHLEDAAADGRTLIFYEAPHKLTRTLSDMLKAFGEREIALARELTKKFEEIERTTLSAALEKYEKTPPKGEFVLVIRGKREEDNAAAPPDISALLRNALGEGLSGRDAVTRVSAETGQPKNAVYAALTRREGESEHP